MNRRWINARNDGSARLNTVPTHGDTTDSSISSRHNGNKSSDGNIIRVDKGRGN